MYIGGYEVCYRKKRLILKGTNGLKNNCSGRSGMYAFFVTPSSPPGIRHGHTLLLYEPRNHAWNL